jgi:hypothetical protein
MSVLRCDRCGTRFDTDDRFTTVDVDAVGREDETLAQVLLCAACTDAVGDALSLETAVHERN